METKQCQGKGSCGKIKPLSDFEYYNYQTRKGYRNICKECYSVSRKNKYNSSVKLKQSKSKYHQENRQDILVRQKQYRKENKEKISLDNKKWREENKEHIRIQRKTYRQNNKLKLRKKQNVSEKDRIKNDPNFRMRKLTSKSINRALRANGGSKNGKSILKFLPYSIEELKLHIENLFEPWMSWNNHGIYNPQVWDDNDPSTWTWQLDHIIPHSTFKYTTMDCQDFRDCWALSNLRPLSAKINNLDGSTKIRHVTYL